jgi:monovalent cation/hydrogen antiporter
VASITVITGSFSLAYATGRFFYAVVGGIAIGIAVGYVVRNVRRRLDDPPLEVTISLLTGYLAFLPAQAIGASGVLAAVTVGIYMGWYTPEVTDSRTRLQGQALWEIVFFVLNAVLFMLVGLQLPAIVDALSGYSTAELIGWAALVTVTVTAVRLVWLFATARLPGRFRPVGADSWRALVVLGWSGMRGAVSLAAALALPLTTDAGDAFPNRDLIVFLTFGVILGTLVCQGLTLPALIKVLHLEEDGLAEKEEAKARIKAAQAALSRLDEVESEGWANDDTIERMRGLYGFRVNRFRERFDPDGDGALEERSLSYQRLRRELLDAEREAVADLRRRQLIDDEIARRVTRDLDLEDLRLDV